MKIIFLGCIELSFTLTYKKETVLVKEFPIYVSSENLQLRLGTQPCYHFGNSKSFLVFIQQRGKPLNETNKGNNELLFAESCNIGASVVAVFLFCSEWPEIFLRQTNFNLFSVHFFFSFSYISFLYR